MIELLAFGPPGRSAAILTTTRATRALARALWPVRAGPNGPSDQRGAPMRPPRAARRSPPGAPASPFVRRCRRCVVRRALRRSAAAAPGRRGPGRGRRSGPRPRRRADRAADGRLAAARLDVRAAADARDRRRRGLVALGGRPDRRAGIRAIPVPRRRTVAFLGGDAGARLRAVSGIERYDTTLFSVHMVQHVLLVLVAAPLIAAGRARSRWSCG